MNVLQTLSQLPVETQKDALASATKSLLPQPRETDQQSPALIGPLELSQQVVNEIKDRLKIPLESDSPEAKAKVLAYISKLLSSLLRGDDPSAVKGRLGQRGDLAPRDYKIIYPADFFNFQQGLAIRRNHVEEALSNPTAVQHLSSDIRDRSPDVFPNLSFYAKMHVDHRGAPFSLLVKTFRDKAVQHVYSAWRIYHADIAMPEAYSPLGIFEAFVFKYGEELLLGGKRMGKLLFYKVLPGVSFAEMDGMTAEQPGNPLLTVQLNWTTHKTSNTTYVTFAYSINLARYCADLMLHGIDVHPDKIRLGNFSKNLRFPSPQGAEKEVGL
jgi:hypothetical protein